MPPRWRTCSSSSRPITRRTTPCWRWPATWIPKETLAKVKKYFGSDSAAGGAQAGGPGGARRRRPSAAPRSTTNWRALPRLDIAYRIPAIPSDPDTRALVGGGADSGRRRKFAAVPEAGEGEGGGHSGVCLVDGRAGPSKFQITAMVRPGKTSGRSGGLISEEIARLVSAPVTEKELQRVRTASGAARCVRARACSPPPSRWRTTPPCTTIRTASTPNRRSGWRSPRRISKGRQGLSEEFQPRGRRDQPAQPPPRRGRRTQAELRRQRHDETNPDYLLVLAIVAAGAGAAGPAAAVRRRRGQAERRRFRTKC